VNRAPGAASRLALCCRRPRARARAQARAGVGRRRNGYQHDSISHAVATVERLGPRVGRLRHLHPHRLAADHQASDYVPGGTGIATGETFNVRNLDYFDAIFFFGVREIDSHARAARGLLSFVKDDGKGFVGRASAATAFFSWPEFGEMLGGRFDEHPWGNRRRHRRRRRSGVSGDASPAADEGVPRRALSRSRISRGTEIRVLAHLDASKLDLTQPLVHRRDGDFPAAWAKTYGKGPRVLFDSRTRRPRTGTIRPVRRCTSKAIRWAPAARRRRRHADSPAILLEQKLTRASRGIANARTGRENTTHPSTAGASVGDADIIPECRVNCSTAGAESGRALRQRQRLKQRPATEQAATARPAESSQPPKAHEGAAETSAIVGQSEAPRWGLMALIA
jgi:type 1 glutamine amidotransferase